MCLLTDGEDGSQLINQGALGLSRGWRLRSAWWKGVLGGNLGIPLQVAPCPPLIGESSGSRQVASKGSRSFLKPSRRAHGLPGGNPRDDEGEWGEAWGTRLAPLVCANTLRLTEQQQARSQQATNLDSRISRKPKRLSRVPRTSFRRRTRATGKSAMRTKVVEECVGAEVSSKKKTEQSPASAPVFQPVWRSLYVESTSVERSINTCSPTYQGPMLILRRRDADDYFYM